MLRSIPGAPACGWAILSNGNPETYLGADVWAASGLAARCSRRCWSVDAVGVFKPDARVYRLGVEERCGVTPGQGLPSVVELPGMPMAPPDFGFRHRLGQPRRRAVMSGLPGKRSWTSD